MRQIILKRNKNIFFLIFWARQRLTLVLRILIKNEKSGLRSSLKILSFKKVGLFYIFDILNYLKKWCHMTRTVGQTPKEKKISFGIFENECHAMRATGQTQ